jgi:hypothetical protein
MVLALHGNRVAAGNAVSDSLEEGSVKNGLITCQLFMPFLFFARVFRRRLGRKPYGVPTMLAP